MTEIGIAAVDITPQVAEFCSIRMVPGKRCTGIHDRLRATALYLRADAAALLIISADSVQIPAAVVARIKAPMFEDHGLRPDQIVVSATHAHHTPDILGEEFVDNRRQVDRLVAGCVQT